MDTHTGTNEMDGRSHSDPLSPDEPRGWVTVEGYEFREIVRRTPTNDVFLAYHRPTGAFRELLVVHRVPEVGQDALRRAIEAEVAAARAVSHVGLAPIEDVGVTQDGRLYVVSARPVGRSLRALLVDDGRLPVLRAFELGHTLVTALAVAHERNLVHGWLTADSVVIIPPRSGWPERAVVVGLGTAAAQDAGLTVGACSAEQSRYMSPERIAGGPPSFRGDVFGLGSLLLSMFTGSAPSMVRIADAAGEPLAHAAGPRDIEQVLRRARAFDPDERYATAGALGTALWTVHNTWFATQGADPTATGWRAPAGRTPGRRSMIAAGLLVTAAAAAAGVAAARVMDSRRPVTFDATQAVAARPAPPASSPPDVAAPPLATAPASTVAGAPAAAATATVPPTAGSERVASVDAPRPAPPNTTRPTPSRPRPSVAASLPTTTTNRPTAPLTVTTSSAGDVVAAPPSSRAATTGAEMPPASPATAPTTVPTTAVATVTPTVTDAAPSDAASEASRGARASEVLAVVADYGTAVGARDLSRLERLYPAMTDQQRRGWRAFFNSVSELRAPITVEQITVAGTTAQVRVRAAYEYENLRPHRAERSIVNYKLTLAREGAGWRIRAVE